MKKFLALLLALTMALCLAACGDNSNQPAGSSAASGSGSASGNSVKVGFIMLHDENSTYDLNFINGAKEACEALGITDYIIKTNIGENNDCYDAACELAGRRLQHHLRRLLRP